MARTRGASHVIHVDDGELVEVVREVEVDPAPVVEAPPAVYLCDLTTVGRDMEAHELVRILDLLLGGFSIRVEEAQYKTLHPDVRRHMRRVSCS